MLKKGILQYTSFVVTIQNLNYKTIGHRPYALVDLRKNELVKEERRQVGATLFALQNVHGN